MNQPAGLKNLGNTCFMNASLQIIAALYGEQPGFPDALKNVIQAINGGYQVVAAELLQALREFLGSLENDKGTKILAIATSGKQECACDFLTLLDKQYPFMAKWLEQTPSGKSTSSILLLQPIQADVVKTLSETGACVKYGTQYTVAAANQGAEILAIYLDRNANFSKLGTQVTNTKTIQVRNAGDTDNKKNFELGGFIVHAGSGRGGHYDAYVKKGNTWYWANDATVTRVTEHEAVSKSAGASLLFYTKTK